MQTKSALQNAPIVDFTGTFPGAIPADEFGSQFIELVRGSDKPAAVVIIDRAVGGELKQPAVVADHLNLSGANPLCGPNHECGERFPVIQNIYIDDALPGLPSVVVAGLKSGIKPDVADIELIHDLGASVCCYNVVSAMLVAAHARCRVLAIVLPENGALEPELVRQIKNLTGDKA